MSSNLIQRAAELMCDQAAAYGRLDALAKQLTGALVRGNPESIEALVRTGESELLRMRARLVQITNTLTAFADARALAADNHPIEPAARAAFEEASGGLLCAAREFQRTHALATSLSLGGSSFASACIENCGVPPTTYRGPYARRGEVPTWA